MRYHTSVINLFTCRRQPEPEKQKSPAAESEVSQASETSQQKSPTTTPSPKTATTVAPGKTSPDITLSSARSIAELVRIHRREFGMSRSHAFALYAVNLALFVILDHPDFDLFDADFLSLAGAFSIVASRSILGRNLYQVLRQSLRSRGKAQAVIKAKDKEPSTRFPPLPDELKDLLLGDDHEEEPSPVSASSAASSAFTAIKGSRSSSSSDEDDGRSDVSSSGKREGESKGEGGGGLGVCEMLERYEALSLGKEERDERK